MLVAHTTLLEISCRGSYSFVLWLKIISEDNETKNIQTHEQFPFLVNLLCYPQKAGFLLCILDCTLRIKTLEYLVEKKRTKIVQMHSKKEGKIQELIQLSTTPDPGYQWESDNVTIRHHKRPQEASLFPAGDHKASTNRRA